MDVAEEISPLPVSEAMAHLTQQQQTFCKLYISHDGNAKLAAIEAGYSEKSARVQGPRLLQNTAIQQVIEELTLPINAELQFEITHRMAKLSEIVNTDAVDEVRVEHQLRAIDIANKVEGSYVHAIDLNVNSSWQDYVREDGAALREADKAHPEWRDGYEKSLRNKTPGKK